MRDFVDQQLAPGQVFDKRQAVDWFATHYPDIRPTTVQMHVEVMAVNAGSRKHHPSIKPGSGHDLFYKVAPGKFRLWNADTDTSPIYRDQTASTFATQTQFETEESSDDPDLPSSEFAFERDLRNYLAKNLGSLEPGLKLFKEEGFTGIEYPVGGRFIDILAVDRNSSLSSLEYREAIIGLWANCSAWVNKNLAEGQKVRGAIVASEITEDLMLAASLVSDVQLVEYEIALKLKPLGRSE